MTARIRVVWGGQEAFCELEQEDGLVPFDSFDEIPLFADEEEEAAWFAMHRPSGRLLEDEIRRGRERRGQREENSPALRRLRKLVPPRPREHSRIYPHEDEGKRIVELREVPDFASDAERESYWQFHTLARTTPLPARGKGR